MRKLLFCAIVALFAWGGIGANLHAIDPIEPFQLADQSGNIVDVSASENFTLITFYRGDW